MKVDFGNGCYLEGEEGPRTTQWHKRIVKVKPIPDTRTGHVVTLDCGHKAQTFGDLERCCGVILCTQCRDREKP